MGKLAIIPARGGSKRIKKKNIKSFLDKPIIAYSIEAAISSGLFDEVMVSTDDDEIAEISKKYGANVPFLRSKENANDFAVLADVVSEVIEDYSKHNKIFDQTCCILPTAPFINSKKLEQSLSILLEGDYDTVFSVLEYSFPIQRSLKIENRKVEMLYLEYKNARSQDLDPRYHDSGQFYWLNTKRFIETKSLYTSNSGAIIISQLEAQDIDNETDWKLAEMKYKLMLDGQ